jgi:hypothetical protein
MKTDAERLAELDTYARKLEAAQVESVRRLEDLERSCATTQAVIRQVHLALLQDDREFALRLVLEELSRVESEHKGPRPLSDRAAC